MRGTPQATKRTSYKQPKRLNIVTLLLLAIVATAVYVGYAMWPVVNLRMRVQSELEDVLPQLYRANLRQESVAKKQEQDLRKELATRLPKAGVKGKYEIRFFRNKNVVAMEVHFSTTTTFPILDKKRVFQLVARAQTDAARVEW